MSRQYLLQLYPMIPKKQGGKSRGTITLRYRTKYINDDSSNWYRYVDSYICLCTKMVIVLFCKVTGCMLWTWLTSPPTSSLSEQRGVCKYQSAIVLTQNSVMPAPSDRWQQNQFPANLSWKGERRQQLPYMSSSKLFTSGQEQKSLIIVRRINQFIRHSFFSDFSSSRLLLLYAAVPRNYANE